MKKLLLLLICPLALIASASVTTHTVTFNVTTSVTCTVGDTLKLFGTAAGDYVAALQSGTTTLANINPTMVSVAPFYVGYFVISGPETLVFFAEISQGSRPVDLTVNQLTQLTESHDWLEAQLFPNPFETTIQVQAAPESLGQAAFFCLLDAQGAARCEGSIVPQPAGRLTLELPAALAEGLYYLVLYNSEKCVLARRPVLKQQ